VVDGQREDLADLRGTDPVELGPELLELLVERSAGDLGHDG
jgi:hypothetical protein